MATRRAAPVPEEARAALEKAEAQLRGDDPASALATIDAIDPEAEGVLAVEVLRVKVHALEALGRGEESLRAARAAADVAERLGWLARAARIVYGLVTRLGKAQDQKGALVACVLSLLSAVAVYLVLRAGALGSPLPSAPHAPLADVPFFERLVYASRSLLEGWRVFFFPAAHPPNS